ncbi:hypothetical protein A8L34_09665 [Bacillus sp. FJAT-27264]|uniref:nucleotidyltransferase family protein n=1 Tax=Paenibacillus sp. (strain DSM 101736 / FJAT-27264) TaxID=1850362 RepID=UPI000807DAA8|nr:nucleotidyltransferase family protein [Bacillus sp. FJAT-27264]OBZ14218.1 hypothetical protein A8L34_09665 [Bacillus sp. FJAT-27264]
MTQDLLLEMLRASFCNESSSMLSQYPQNESLLELAYQHDVGLLIGDRMQLNRSQRLANNILKQKNLKRYHENFVHFDPVAVEFENSNVEYVTTKGVYAAKTAYIDEGYRRSDDLDVIIKREDYSKVREILHAQGYIQGIYNSTTKTVKEFSRQQELFYLSYTQQSAPFLKETGDDLVPVVNLDLNFHIFWDESEAWDISKLLSNSQILNYKGFKVRTFQDEYMLLHMCIHAYFDMNSVYILYKSYAYRLKYFADIYGFIKRSKVSWSRFRSVCIDNKVEKYIMYILYYTALVFQDDSLLTITGLEMPSEVFLNRFGLENEGSFIWEESFLERLFNTDRDILLDKYFNEEMKLKISQGRSFEGM